MNGLKESLGAAEVNGDDTVCKVSIVGVGMRSHSGVAATMFRSLAEEGINIQMISTSEIKVSVLIDKNTWNWPPAYCTKPSVWNRLKPPNQTKGRLKKPFSDGLFPHTKNFQPLTL